MTRFKDGIFYVQVGLGKLLDVIQKLPDHEWTLRIYWHSPNKPHQSFFQEAHTLEIDGYENEKIRRRADHEFQRQSLKTLQCAALRWHNVKEHFPFQISPHPHV